MIFPRAKQNEIKPEQRSRGISKRVQEMVGKAKHGMLLVILHGPRTLETQVQLFAKLEVTWGVNALLH